MFFFHGPWQFICLVVEILITTCDYLCARFLDNVVFYVFPEDIYTHVHCYVHIVMKGLTIDHYLMGM